MSPKDKESEQDRRVSRKWPSSRASERECGRTASLDHFSFDDDNESPLVARVGEAVPM